ncbi:hypothetical protein VTN00DRAFT_669 [Thermoascus crustaceus]|uniref:uncharacterized protein n=1 Tax=Thermoascus crustaceus TaxID=5088 RepID=UPI0037446C1A
MSAESPQTFLFINNEDGSTVTTDVHAANAEDIDRAVAAAETAFKKGPWASFTARQRANCILKFADLLTHDTARIVQLETICSGIPAGIVNYFITFTADTCRFYAGLAETIQGGSTPIENDSYGIMRKQPFGVCAAIGSFNATIACVALKVVPALAAGNTVIYKASKLSPLSTLALGPLFVEAPPGVVNLVSGAGSTGSVNTGKKIQELAAKSNLKKILLELGASRLRLYSTTPIFKKPYQIAQRTFSHSRTSSALVGNNNPLATSRLYVQEGIAEQFLAGLKASFEAASAGMGADPMEESTAFGPLVSKQQYERVKNYLEIGKKTARLVTGGNPKDTNGFHVEQTIFVDPEPTSHIYKEESFGPVQIVKTFKTEEEVLELANDTEYGLSAAIFSKDISRVLRVAERLECGGVVVNQRKGLPQALSYGGWKQSGLGRELGVESLQEFLQLKSIAIGL